MKNWVVFGVGKAGHDEPDGAKKSSFLTKKAQISPLLTETPKPFSWNVISFK